MKHSITLLLLFAIGACTLSLKAQTKPTEEEYLKKDSLLWAQHENRQDSIRKEWQAHPEKQESLEQESKEVLSEALRKNRLLAMEYASVPSGLHRLFMVRLGIGKDTLDRILTSLPPQMQESPYGKAIRKHIDMQQMQIGRRLYRFPATKADGQEMEWSELQEKYVLMIYGGLSCMGENGREYLKRLTQNISQDRLAIIVYWPCNSAEELKKASEKYQIDCTLLSDFEGDRGLMKIAYGAQAQPTCFLFDDSHKAILRTEGLDYDALDEQLAPLSTAGDDPNLVRGKVTSLDKTPLAQVVVAEIDDDNRIISAAKTDENGMYTLKIKDPENKLRFKLTDYFTLFEKIGTRRFFNIRMEKDESEF